MNAETDTQTETILPEISDKFETSFENYSDIQNSYKIIKRFIDKKFEEITSNYYLATHQRIYFSNEFKMYSKNYDILHCNGELIRNAFDSILAKKAQDSSHIGKIAISISSNTDLIFQIEDNGKGVSNYAEKYLFKQKVTSEKVKPSPYEFFGGIGIGLINLNKTVTDLNGSCGYINNIPNGAEFYYRVPLESLVLK